MVEAAAIAPSETERHRLLVEARAHADGVLAEDLDVLIPAVSQWARGLDHWVAGDQEQAGEDGYLGGFLLGTLPGDDPTPWPPALSEGSALEPLRGFYRGRGLIWRAIQDGILVSNQAGRDLWFGEGRGLIATFDAAHPGNPLVPMYLDGAVDWPIERDADAPQWADDQRVALTRLTEIAEFWASERQAPDGQLGGGWGDDVELWRQLRPVLLGFEHDSSTAMWTALSDGIFELPRLQGGYTDVFTDVEHSAEDTGDTVTPMLMLSDDLVWAERADRIAELFEGTWSGTNERGFRQFQSTYFGSGGVSDLESRACDTVYHARALQPALLRWQRGAEVPGLEEWLRAWVDATASDARGKPAGAIPSAIHWPSGEPGGPENRWWEPGCALNAGAFDWPSAMSLMTRTLVLAWHRTGDEDFLAPIRSMAELRRAWLAEDLDDAEGSAGWVGKKSTGFLAEALAKHWMLSGSDEFADLLAADGDAIVDLHVFGDRTAIEDQFADDAAGLSINEAAYTTEVRWTDRVMRFGKSYADHYASSALPRAKPDRLYSAVTGDPGDAGYLPLPAVRWGTDPKDIAALVTRVRGGLRAELYSFRDGERAVEARLTTPGAWSLDCGGSGEGGMAAFTLPPRRLCVFEVAP